MGRSEGHNLGPPTTRCHAVLDLPKSAIMNGQRPQVNGQHLLNGATSTQHHQATEAKISRIDGPAPHGKQAGAHQADPYTNGVLPKGTSTAHTSALAASLQQAPVEVLQLIGREHYLPMSTMVNRTAQNCWNSLASLVDQLSAISVPPQAPDPIRISSGVVNNQTKANLDKKERILQFVDDQKADFIKLLVLLQWSKNGEDVRKAMNLNFWLMNRRFVYLQARDALARLKQDALGFQIPNPDLKTAGEVLSLGKATGFPDIGYKQVKPLKRKHILSTLHKLSRIVSVRLALDDSLPPRLRTYHVHDGRATFVVQNEFELDLSVLEESPAAPFRVVDFRFAYSPRPNISNSKRQEIEFVANAEIDHSGLLGCYDFFHNLVITAKLTEFYKQALELSRNQWAGHLRAEMLRRDLVVEYWRGRDVKKSWIEISVRSGRGQQTDIGSRSQPYLGVRWFREGKEVHDFELDIDFAELSFESILLQIIAQHVNCVLELVYERLTTANLFREGGLLVELSTSAFEPKDCMVEMQMTRGMKVAVTIDPVNGSFVLNPASDRAHRLQSDLNRSRVKGEDLIARLLNFRCILAEDSILRALKDTSWRRLDAFKPAANDIGALFGTPMARVNLFRHANWSSDYFLAITNNVDGDRFWILNQSAHGKAASLANFRVVQEQPIRPHHELSARFFDSFADYASGVVTLYSNVAYINAVSPRYKLPTISEFDGNCHLPALSFEVADGSLSLSSRDAQAATSSTAALAGTIRLTYQGIDATFKSSILSVELRCQMESAVLERLAASNLDSQLTFAPKKGLVLLEVPFPIGKPAIKEIIERTTRLNDVLACIRTTQSLSSTTLESVSMTAMTISHKFGESTESRIAIRFPGVTDAPGLEFLPPGTDPHECLVPQISQLLKNSYRSFSANLSNVLSSLILTHPLVMGLHDLQRSPPPRVEGTEASDAHKIRLHVLVRQPTMFALQFFASADKGVAEDPKAMSHERLVARFEILPSVKYSGQWLLRPAIEEVSGYIRASFAAKALRDKVRDEIFAKKGTCADWIRLDMAAVFLKDKPRPLLEALQSVILDWIKTNPVKVEELPPAEPTIVKKDQPKPTLPKQAPALKVNGNVNANRKPLGQPSKPPPNQNPKASTPHNPKNIANKGPAKNKEVITLD